MTRDVEGLSLYYGANGTGYLLASSQGSSGFVVYERAGSNPYKMTFGVDKDTVDGVSTTDGIDTTNVNLGSACPEGAFIAQDNFTTIGTTNTNTSENLTSSWSSGGPSRSR